ncbi:methyltransferase [Alloactinosynnema sp. L-07]|uniref:class I SAM-dependent methyltransferase n=1 Tax=Alloactinosynnema sp. L-07 TaxID=1653480 RepID=UPI00065F0420|nr:class I SAM-dependent methyltransferase [Alloactinosynnema sp. L-07]CRK62057.1 methyltransferase [Alloactinosynnema sp. L-07]
MSDDAVALRAKMYGEDDLSSLPVFAGGFINFGYWRDIPIDGEITVDQRVDSQLALYRLVMDKLGVGPADAVVEIGSGTGVGAAWAVAEVGPREWHGVDLSPDQVRRASAHATDRLAFHQGAATAIPFPDDGFDVALSLEAAQHMDDIAGFAAEASRVLRPGGRFAVCTFFAPDADHPGELARRLETFAAGVDRDHAVPAVVSALTAAGFAGVDVTAIGEHVWAGLDRWLVQLGVPDDEWPRRWLTCYRDGLIDYYLISATVPSAASR